LTEEHWVTKANTEAGDVAGNRERDSPSLLKVTPALASTHRAESQATDT